MRRWELLIVQFPNLPCYHLRPEDAWDLPYPTFRDLSDIQTKLLDKWSSG